MPQNRTIIIGSGVAGLGCARRLADAGVDVTILDKGRGIGGRLATRRTQDGWQFDHGAQYITARDPGFQDVINNMRIAGMADVWQDGSSEPHLVGVPGMNGLAKHLGAGLDILQNETAAAIGSHAEGWSVVTGSQSFQATRVVITTPAPQVPDLIGQDHPLAKRIEHVKIAPCLTLMAAFQEAQPAPFISHRDSNQALSWIAHNSTKPGRPGPGCWVAQASIPWSVEHLELDREDIAQHMLPMLCDRIGADPSAAQYVAAHRWRYANVTTALGQPFLRDSTQTLYLGGDWCIGPRVEAAWLSGRAIADDILANI